MKNFFLIIAAFFLILTNVFAQSDSTHVQYTEEPASSSDFNLKESYNYLIRAQVEEKTLIKVGIHGFGFTGINSHLEYGYLVYGIGIEQKIKPSFSVLANFLHMAEYNNPKYDRVQTFYDGVFFLNVGARYYYNINARIRKGKSANNFSANYLGIYQQNTFAREKATDTYHAYSNLSLLYGLQRRIGKYGFIDFGVGPMLEQQQSKKYKPSLNILFSIGLAF